MSEIKSVETELTKSDHTYYMRDKMSLILCIILLDRLTDLRDYLDSISNDIKTMKWMGGGDDYNDDPDSVARRSRSIGP